MNSLCTYVIVSLGHLIIQKVKFAQEILDLERLGGKCLKDKYYHMSCTLSNYTLIYWTRVKNMFCDSESGDDSGFDTRCIRVFIMYQEEHGACKAHTGEPGGPTGPGAPSLPVSPYRKNKTTILILSCFKIHVKARRYKYIKGFFPES